MKTKSRRQVIRKSEASPPSVKLLVGILAALTVVAYWNSFDVPLVFDDLVTIQKNAGVRLGEFFLNPSLLAGRGLLFFTFAANYLAHGQEVWGYHLVNLTLHVLTGLLVLIIAAHIFRKVGLDPNRALFFAFVAAGAFLLHPVQTESVTYISSRSELLSTFFYALAFLIFIKVPDEKVGFVLSLVVTVPFLFALMSKETAITLPGVMVLYDFLFRSDSRLRLLLSRWRFYITFVVGGASVIYYFVTGSLSGSIGGSLEGHLRPWSYLLTQLRVIVRYVAIIIFPTGLNLDHHVQPSYTVFEGRVLLSLLVLLGVAAIAWSFRRKQPVVSFSIFWFFITLSPTSSFVPILDLMFEHRLYLPLVGVCLLFPLTFHYLQAWIVRRWQYSMNANYACVVLLLLFAAATAVRNHVWRDEIRLWSDVIAKSPGKARGYNALSFTYFKRGQYEPALETARLGLQTVPGESGGFYETIGNMNLRMGRFPDATRAFTESAKLAGDKRKQSTAHNNVGVSYLYQWHSLRDQQARIPPEQFLSEKDRLLTLAAEAFRKSFELEEDTFSAFDSYINALHNNNKDDQIVPLVQARFGQEDYRTFYALAKVADWHGRLDEADAYYQKASVRRDQPMIYFNHAIALTSLQKTQQAIDKYLLALRLDPLFVEANHNIALLYRKTGNVARALEHLQEVLRMDPNHSPTHLEMAKIYLQDKRRSEAREHLSVILANSPGHPEATRLWQLLGS